jgi:hypothetical protein
MVVPRALLMALLALLMAAPAAEAAKRRVPRGFYGVMWDRDARSAPDALQDEQWALMARSGVESVRTVFSWPQAQPEPDEPPSFAETDPVVARAAQRRLRLLPVVSGTPDWARLYPEQFSSPPAREDDYAAYLTALIGRYGPQGSFWSEHPELPRRPVREWQIWNEPHLDYYWLTPDGPWAPGYTRLLQVAYRAVKSADRGATVVLAAVADYVWRHIDSIYDQGGRGSFDVAAVNFFSAKPSNVVRAVRRARKVMREHRERRKPIWLTEVTWPAAKGRDIARADWQEPWIESDRGVARRLTSVYSLLARDRRKLGLGRAYWYTWSSEFEPGDLFNFAGLLSYRGAEFEPRPALRAYRASARRHEGCAKTSTAGCR